MKNDMVIVLNKWRSLNKELYPNNFEFSTDIKNVILNEEKDLGLQEGVYYPSLDWIEPYEDDEIQKIKNTKKIISVSLSLLNPFEYKNPPTIMENVYLIDDKYKYTVLFITTYDYFIKKEQELKDDYAKKVQERKIVSGRKLSTIRGFVTKKGSIYDATIGKRAYNPNKKINKPKLKDTVLAKKEKDLMNGSTVKKEVYEQSVDELLKNDDSIWFLDVNPDTMLDFDISKGKYNSVNRLRKKGLNPEGNNHTFQIDKDSLKIYEPIDDTGIDHQKIKNDGFNAIKNGDDVQLLDNFDRTHIKKFDYINELINAAKNGKNIPKSVIDATPELTSYLTSKDSKVIPEFKNYEEASKWFSETHPNIKLNLKNIDLPIVNETLNQFHKLAQQFPEAANQMKYIGLYTGGNKKYGQRYATSNRDTGELGLDPDYYEVYPEEFQKKIDKSVASGYHPRGSNNFGFVITHEFGHFLEWSMRGDKSKSSQIKSFIYKENEPDSKLSKYSMVDMPLNENPIHTGASEWFAEAFASMYYTPPEYQHSLTKKVKEKLENLTNKKIKTRWG